MNAYTQIPVAPPPEALSRALAYRSGMRKLAGAVSVLTVGQGDSRTGLTATSVTSLSAEPPVLIICVNRDASARAELTRTRAFGINVLRAGQEAIADRFAGRNGEKGPARYAGATWTSLATGAPILAEALVAFDCVLEEAIERHSHTIVLGRVASVRITEGVEPLVYWNAGYRALEL